MAKYILLAVSGAYVFTALAFTVSYTWEYSSSWNLVSLMPHAIEHGYTWPVRLFGQLA